MDPERLEGIMNFIRQFKSDIAPPDTSDNFSESNRSVSYTSRFFVLMSMTRYVQ
jgi:hypothetical protein